MARFHRLTRSTPICIGILGRALDIQAINAEMAPGVTGG
jgi:hypothetical protein